MSSRDKGNVKRVNFTINTTQKHLDSIGLTIDDVQEETLYLAKILGFRYERLFPLNIQQHDIDYIHYVAPIFKAIDQCKGFKKFVRQLDKNNIHDHLFTAKVADWLINFGMDIELEPEIESKLGGKPDILAVLGKDKLIVECKNFDIDSLYEHEKKKALSELVYKLIPTCDQIDLYLKSEMEPDDLEKILNVKEIQSEIYKRGASVKESRFNISDKLDIGIIQKPPIVGAENNFLAVTVQGILGDVQSGLRLPGYWFMKGGRSVGVFGPPPNFRRRWNDKRRQSKKQAVEDLPMIVVMNGDNILGEPEAHDAFFFGEWLNANNSMCSAIGIIEFTTLNKSPKVSIKHNAYADTPIPKVLMDKITS